jgi:HD-GYP domain-containing protein (c-di-GMP phosphodiesterase class II)/HAMP domain-containing protein
MHEGANAAGGRRRRYPLGVLVATIFVILLLVAGLTIGGLAYNRSSAMLTRAADDLFDRVASETTQEMRAIVAPGEALVDVLAQTRLAVAGTLAARLETLPLLREALTASPNVSALYAGYANGDFFLLRRLPRNVEERRQLGAPEQAAYLVQNIERSAGVTGTFVWLDSRFALIATEVRPDFAGFDPRERPWYRAAVEVSEQVKMPPYVFFTTREVGVTLARRAPGANATAVVAADVTLGTISEALARQRITPGSEIAMVSASGHVTAHPDPARLLRGGAAGEPPVPVALAQFGVPVLAALAEHVASAREPQTVQLDVGGRVWRSWIAPLPLQGVAQPPRLVLAVPRDELLTEARAIARESALTTGFVIAVALVLALAAANWVARPMRALAEEADAIGRFEFSRPVRIASMAKEVDQLAATMDKMKRTIRRFLDITAAVAAEPDLDRLMPRLLDETIAATSASAGVLYLLTDDGAMLTPAVTRLAHGEPPSAQPAPIDLAEKTSAHPVLEAVRAREARAFPLQRGSPSTGDLDPLVAMRGDEQATLIVAPLTNRRRELLGAVAIACPEQANVGQDLVDFVGALTGAAAVSLETKQLLQTQKALFDAFIRLIAGAIDAKSPYTGGHCARVPELTKMLARAACAASTGPYKDFQLSEQDWEAVHLGAWLHDCGKVTTPEYVVDKATKLETIYDRIHEVRMRFEVLKRDAEIDHWKQIAEGGDPARLRGMLESHWRALDDDFAFVAACNEGREYMAPDDIARLQAIAARTWVRTLDDRIGIAHDERSRKERELAAPLPALERLLADKPEHVIERRPEERMDAGNCWGFRVDTPEHLYNRGELYNLCVARGTLSAEERYKINEHMIQTIIMLSALPFPRHLRQVPEIAGGHHEKMDGTGYPKRLTCSQMSPVARMMAIADIFEALTAADRPYKEAKTLSEALGIMHRMCKDRHIDPELFELFLAAGVYREYAERYLRPEQIDAVDLAKYAAA